VRTNESPSATAPTTRSVTKNVRAVKNRPMCQL
jgi:hypothetical protein